MSLGVLSIFQWTRQPLPCKNSDCEKLRKAKGTLVKEIRLISKEQRHDYMNMFQIVYGYLQLKKEDRAIEEIKRIANIASSISIAYNLSITSLCLLLDKKIREADNHGIEITYNVNSYIDIEYRDIENENDLVSKMENVINLVIKSMQRESLKEKLIIQIFEYDDRITVVFKGKFPEILIKEINQNYSEFVVENNNLEATFNLEMVNRLEPEKTIFSRILHKS